MASHLRTVGPDEKPAKRETPKSITDALEGSARDVLAAMRKKLAKQLDAGDIASNSIASAYRELRELDRLIRVADEAAEDEAPAGAERGKFDASAV